MGIWDWLRGKRKSAAPPQADAKVQVKPVSSPNNFTSPKSPSSNNNFGTRRTDSGSQQNFYDGAAGYSSPDASLNSIGTRDWTPAPSPAHHHHHTGGGHASHDSCPSYGGGSHASYDSGSSSSSSYSDSGSLSSSDSGGSCGGGGGCD